MAVITISRQYGSGGDEVANLVATMLQYRLFDKTIMTLVAAEMGLSEVQRIRDTEHISVMEAQKVTSERDAASADYLKRFHDIDWSDVMLYHLVINTGRWGIEAAAQVISNGIGYLPQVDSSEDS